MEKLLFYSILAALFAFGVGISVPTSNHKGTYSAIDEAKLNTFTKIGEKYYTIVDDLKLTWFGAAHFCRRMDAQLATIESEEEWQALSSHLISKGYTDKQRFWLSGNNLDNMKDFYWFSNGQPMHYSKWSLGQPDNLGGTEHCAQLWPSGKEYPMNDAPCTNEYNYICEAASPKTITIVIW